MGEMIGLQTRRRVWWPYYVIAAPIVGTALVLYFHRGGTPWGLLGICGGAAFLLMCGWLVWEFVTAPDGYEDDETGFHYGDPPKGG